MKKHDNIKKALSQIDEDYYDESQSRGFIPPEDEKESMAKFIRLRNTPEMGHIVYRNEATGVVEKEEGFKELSKDLRLGFLPKSYATRMFDPGLLIEFTDVAIQARRRGHNEFANFLTALRDTSLNISASLNGFEIKEQSSSHVNLTKATQEEKKEGMLDMFKRNRGSAQ